MAKDKTVEQTETKPQEDQNIGQPQANLQIVEPAEIKDGQIIFTPKHLELIKNQIAKEATSEEFDLFLMMARRTRLDPLLKQLYFIKYGNQVSYVTSIDSYRIIAHRTGLFVGVDEPVFEYDKTGKLTHCTVTVYKLIQSERYSFSAKVKFSEYNTGKNQWASKPETMIAKVAEAHALRKAFPQDLSGVYTADEMDQATLNSKPDPKRMITNKQHGEILELLGQKGKTQVDLIKFIKEAFKLNKVQDLSFAQANGVIKRLNRLADYIPEEPPVEDYDDSIVTDPTEADLVADDVPF